MIRIREILSEIFSPHSSFGDKFLSAIIMLLMLAAVGLVVLLGFVLVDSVGITPTKTAITVIKVKQVVPAYTTIIMVGKIIAPQHNPESYRLKFNIEGKELSVRVEKKFFDDVKVGDRIEVEYGFGRLSKSYQLRQIRLMAR